MHRSLSSGKRSQSSMSGHGNPKAAITGAQPCFTLSHNDLHGWMGSSKSSKHTGANREQRNFLVSGWHCFCTRGIQDPACCRTSFMVSCPRRFGSRISVYSMSWHRSRFAGMGLQLLFFWNNSGWPKAYIPWIASIQAGNAKAQINCRIIFIVTSWYQLCLTLEFKSPSCPVVVLLFDEQFDVLLFSSPQNIRNESLRVDSLSFNLWFSLRRIRAESGENQVIGQVGYSFIPRYQVHTAASEVLCT